MNKKAEISKHFSSFFPEQLVSRLINNFLLIKENYYLGRYRETSQYGGRYAEIVIRMLQFSTNSGNYTPLGTQLPAFHDIVVKIGNLPKTDYNESVRIQIPRALDVLYGIRNKRDVGHVTGDLDANYIDANLSLTISSWILCELLRINYIDEIDKAQKIVDEIIELRIPFIQDFNGFLKLLDTKMKPASKIIAIAFYKNKEGITYEDLRNWIGNLHDIYYIKKILERLTDEQALLHYHKDQNKYFITHKGVKWALKEIKFFF